MRLVTRESSKNEPRNELDSLVTRLDSSLHSMSMRCVAQHREHRLVARGGAEHVPPPPLLDRLGDARVREHVLPAVWVHRGSNAGPSVKQQGAGKAASEGPVFDPRRPTGLAHLHLLEDAQHELMSFVRIDVLHVGETCGGDAQHE